MKKYELMYKIVNYAYKKDYFTLHDLMTEFIISKSKSFYFSISLAYPSSAELFGLILS